MDTIWTTLGIEPTKDVSVIKRAYAEKAKTCQPGGGPGGLHEAAAGVSGGLGLC